MFELRTWIQMWVLLLAIIGPIGVIQAQAAPPPQSHEEILAHIDSLHVNRQVEAAATYIEPHLAEARAANDSLFTLPLVAKLGRLWASFGQPKKGEPLLREAAELAMALEDSLRLCDALRWLGYSVEQQGRSTEAVAIYQRQLAAARARDDHRHEAWALVGLAYRAGQEGRYSDAAVDYRKATVLFQDLPDTAAAVWVLNGLGAVLEQNGDFEEAADTYGEAAGLASRIGYKAVEALALNNSGALDFTLGDPGVALEKFRRARALQIQTSQLQDAVSSGTNEANCLLHLGRLDEAVALLNELLKECERGSFLDRESFVLRVLAGVRRLQGRRNEAVRIYRRILAQDDAVLDLRSRIESLVGYAATLAEMDSSAVALEALKEEEGHRNGMLRGTSRVEFELSMAARLRETGATEDALARYGTAVTLTTESGLQQNRVVALAGAARCQRELDKPEAALILLKEAAAAWEDTRQAPTDPEWREQRGSAGRLVYSQLAVLVMGAEGAPAAFDAVQVFKARTLAERIGGRDVTAGQPVVTLEVIQSEIIRDDEVFLDAYLGPTESILFIVTQKDCLAVVWPDEESLADRLHLYRELLATPPRKNSGDGARKAAMAAGRKLGEDLLGEAGPLLAGKTRVILAPDGVLNLVPLNVGNGRQIWVRVPSATIMGYLRRPVNRTGGNGLLAAAASTTPDGIQLPGARREVEDLKKRYGNVELRLDALKPEDLARFDILHLATHAHIDDQRPWSSEIILDASNPAGRLRARDIADLDLGASLAVLSACETGSGRILSGEGVLGLSSAFLSAGVPTVVASLWPVDDRTTAHLMEVFYEELAAGRDPATALAAAQDEIRSDPATGHPFHWAGFVVVGDGTVPVELPTKKPWLLLLLVMAVLLVAVLLTRKRS